MSEKDHLLRFIARVRAARKARFGTQTPMLTILDVEQGNYKHYERRSPLPHRYIPKFCAATGVTFEWLLAEVGSGPAVEELPLPRLRKYRKAKKPKAA